jgi:hypothetical protein
MAIALIALVRPCRMARAGSRNFQEAIMPPLILKISVSVIGLAFIIATVAPAEAAHLRKHKKAVAAYAMAPTKYRGTDKFPAGPIYNARTYLGDDPDPFIRSQLARDVNAVYGGNN